MGLNKDDVMYALKDTEGRLMHESPDGVIASMLDDAYDPKNPGIETTLDKFTWPIQVWRWERPEMVYEFLVKAMGSIALSAILDHLQEDYGDPDGHAYYEEETPRMVQCSETFALAVLEDYVPWILHPICCEKSYTRDDARELLARLHKEGEGE